MADFGSVKFEPFEGIKVKVVRRVTSVVYICSEIGGLRIHFISLFILVGKVFWINFVHFQAGFVNSCLRGDTVNRKQ